MLIPAPDGEDPPSQTVLFEKMAKVQDRGFIRQSVRKPQPGETTHGLNFIQRVFHGRVTQVVEQLQAMNTQHRPKRIRRTAVAGFRVMLAEPFLKLLGFHRLGHRPPLPHTPSWFNCCNLHTLLAGI